MVNRLTPKSIIKQHPELAAIAKQHAGMVEIAILQGDKYRAMASVESAFGLLAEEWEVLPSTPINSIYDEREVAKLLSAGFFTVGQVCAETPESLIAACEIGKKTLVNLQQRLASYGWSLR